MDKVTAIEVQKRNSERVNVFVNYEFAFACAMELVYKEGISVNSYIDESKVKKIIYKEEKIKAKNSALKSLERGFKTEKEIEKKLEDKGFDKTIIAETISFLQEYKFIDDRYYAKLFIKDRMKSKGKNKIRYELQKKGLDASIINEELDSLDCADERENAKNIALKKYRMIKHSTEDERKAKEKLFRYLASRGYEFSMINSIINEIIMEDKNY